MRFVRVLLLIVLVGSAVGVVRADGVSYVGTLASSEDEVIETVDLSSTSTVILQTYGFGGGTNQAGTAIAPGGTAPFLAIFAGTGDSATMVTDALANPYATSVNFGNYNAFMGCPPAGSVSNFGDTTCADITMTIPNLAAGIYTVVLTDGEYIPMAAQDNGTLGEGFFDFTAGAFCNSADVDTGTDCPNTTGAYALDIITQPGTTTAAPEPSSIALLALGLAGVAFWQRRKSVLA
jgi:hypothetical protein